MSDDDDDAEEALKSLQTLVEDVDNLNKDLAPLLSQPLSAHAAKLPLLERSKFYHLLIYGINALLFSALKVNSVDTQDHPIANELERCKEYMSKIENAKQAQQRKDEKSRMRIDREAAARIVRHGVGKPQISKVEERRRDRSKDVQLEIKLSGKRKREEMKWAPAAEPGQPMVINGRTVVDGTEHQSEGFVKEKEKLESRTTKDSKKQAEKQVGEELQGAKPRFKKANQQKHEDSRDDQNNQDNQDNQQPETVESKPHKKKKRRKSSKRPRGSKEAMDSLMREGEKASK